MEAVLTKRKKISITALLYVVLAIMIIIFSCLSSDFYSSYNISSMLTNIAFIGIIACIMTMIMITGGIDMSIGANIALTSCLVAALADSKSPPPLLVILALGILVGAVIGGINGLLITRLNLNPIITTLGTMSIATGLAYVLSAGRSILMFEEVTGFIGRDLLLGIPMPVYWLAVMVFLSGVLLHKSKFGRKIYLIGNNINAARLAGINVNRVRFILYLLCGISAAFSAIILIGQTGVGMPQHGIGNELDIISAVLLGGTAFTGGRGRILGTLAGVLILGVLYNGFTMIGFRYVHIRIFQGILLILIVAFYEIRENRQA